MRTRPRRTSRWTHQPDISLNAFLDLILNILLFFVFATELAVFDAIDVQVPVSEYTESQTTERQVLMIFITKENELLVDGSKLESNELAHWLAEKKASGLPIENVVVRGDLASDLQATIDVLGACRVNGIDKVKIETIKPTLPSSS
ncbi:MAG: biopolymer transporter ExbD [Methylomonas sp.]|jgi:biopolymer transport protein ExbD|uniref:ExbD/TolR family protein n=1 Tax=Methylomonas sp. TaxID=418 RepID=UPI0025FBC8B0|nr:biopolymer transporter ExbD [Methylomonas sp.]MCK9608806.1 biopolymer transporter ExbD [Methylomonas sp.]